MAITAAVSTKDLGARDLMLLSDSDRSGVVAMSNAKEALQLQRCVGYLDREQRALVTGIETDQKLVLARFEAMVRETRMKQAQLACDTYTMSRLGKSKYSAPLKPNVVLNGDRDLHELLGIERPPPSTSTSASIAGIPEIPGDPAVKLPMQPHWRRSGAGASLQQKTLMMMAAWRRYRNIRRRQRSKSRSSSRSPSGRSTSETDDEKANDGRTINARLKGAGRPTTAGEARPANEVGRSESTASRIRSAPATARTESNARHPGSTVRFTPAEQFPHTGIWHRSEAQCQRRSRSPRDRTRSGAAPGRRFAGHMLPRVNRTTIRINPRRPPTSATLISGRTDGGAGDADVVPVPVGYEPDVWECYASSRKLSTRPTSARRGERLTLTTSDDVVDGSTTQLSEKAAGDCMDDRSCLRGPRDDDASWNRETKAQQRVRSLTLRTVSVGGYAYRPSEAELDLAAQKRYQQRRLYMRVSKANEEQKILTRRMHIV